MNAVLKSRKKIGKDVYVVSFVPQGEFVWLAGQHVRLTLPHEDADELGVSRLFSIASAPFEGEVAIITRCGEHASTFKRALVDLSLGGTVELGIPEFDFAVDSRAEEYTFVAAGVGVSPFRSMLLQWDYEGLSLKGTLIYSHTESEFPFKEEFDALQARHPDFAVVYIVDPLYQERGQVKAGMVGQGRRAVYMSGIYVRKVAELYASTVSRSVSSPAGQAANAEEGYLMGLVGE